jgi:uroporphyrinogen decarboxylase
MTSKQRVHAALKKQPVDRVPIFMWYHPITAKQLGKLLEVPANRVSEVMGDDVKMTWVANNHAMEGIVHENEGEGHVDDWGLEWVKNDEFNQIVHSPLEKATKEEILNYQFPYDKMNSLLANMKKVVPYSEEYFIGCDTSPNLFEMVCRLRGMENALLDLISDKKSTIELLQKCEDFSLEISKKACERFPLDWLWTGDDVGGQHGMMMSPDLWRELVKPRLQNIVEIGKSNGLWNAYHSCGSVRPIIPDLIEIGIDVLNPIQCNCPGMDAFELKSEFGENLAFMGGIDTQGLLPKGTAPEIRKYTSELIEKMTNDGGGFILAASHTVPPETPFDNIFAMYEAAGVTKEEIFDRAADVKKAGV